MDDELPALRLRSACNRFRILIIGRPNAGKTTILQKLCNTTDAPIIDLYDQEGTKVRLKLIIRDSLSTH